MARVLIGCEESQTVTKEFRKPGHEVYSCDVLPCSGEHPEWHLQQDISKVLKQEWDMGILFPPCTHLAVSGAKHFEAKRQDGRQREAIEFFMMCMNVDIPLLVVENPVGIISGEYIKKHFPNLAEKHGLPIKPTQKIQPWQFGDEAQKTTCLWLKGLPKLMPTDVVDKGEFVITPSGKKLPKWYSNNKSAKIRSKTFPGIAKAMAIQWSNKIQNNEIKINMPNVQKSLSF